MRTDSRVVAELKRIADRNDGVLMPEDVVEAARPAASPLHSSFDWDDSEAAQKWRLHQARQLLRVTVEYIESDNARVPMRVFVSLTDDRRDGGYRITAKVLSDAEQRKQLLNDAYEEMRWFQKKYAALKELAEVFAAMRRASRKKAA